MPLRLATFNVENLFDRAKALNTITWAEGEPVLQAFDRFNTLANHAVYTDADKQAMLAALEILQVLERTSTGSLRLNRSPSDAWALLRKNRGDLIKQPQSGDVQIVASGRGDWIGWVELLSETVDETAVRMTAKVITEVAADILCVVEAEDRPALVRMNTDLLGSRYGHVMLLDGNDPRGIDIGLCCDSAIQVASIRSHVDVPDPAGTGRPLFSRDCPSTSCACLAAVSCGCCSTISRANRSPAATPTRYEPASPLRSAPFMTDSVTRAELVAVMGDFNKGPTNDQPPQHPTLEPLLGPDSPLVDATTLPGFDLVARQS